jgi:Fe-S-cluster-containing dehydrogenase component
MDITRRDLIDFGTKLLVLASVGASLEQITGAEPPPDAYKMAEHWWGMLIDIGKCIGCGNCVQACAKENNVPDGYYRTWIERYQIEEDKQPKVDSPKGGMDGFPLPTPVDVKSFFVPKLCNHCVDSPCVQVCPVGATFISPDGVVLVDESYCLGCRYCVQACPYGCRFINPKTNTAEKCSLCYHRITKGLTTACCEVCPTGARQLADLKNPKDPIHEFLKTHTVQVLKPHMATGAKVFYNGMDGSVR